MSEFDVGLSKHKALYIPFPQAVLNKYVTDKRGCPPCRFACPTEAITSTNFTTEQIMAEIEGVLV